MFLSHLKNNIRDSLHQVLVRAVHATAAQPLEIKPAPSAAPAKKAVKASQEEPSANVLTVSSESTVKPAKPSRSRKASAPVAPPAAEPAAEPRAVKPRKAPKTK